MLPDSLFVGFSKQVTTAALQGKYMQPLSVIRHNGPVLTIHFLWRSCCFSVLTLSEAVPPPARHFADMHQARLLYLREEVPRVERCLYLILRDIKLLQQILSVYFTKRLC
jgi:hypothetical protein